MGCESSPFPWVFFAGGLDLRREARTLRAERPRSWSARRRATSKIAASYQRACAESLSYKEAERAGLTSLGSVGSSVNPKVFEDVPLLGGAPVGASRRSSLVSPETTWPAAAENTLDRSARTRVGLRPPVFKTVYASGPLNTHVHHRVLLQQLTAILLCPSVALVGVGFPWSRHNRGTIPSYVTFRRALRRPPPPRHPPFALVWL